MNPARTLQDDMPSKPHAGTAAHQGSMRSAALLPAVWVTGYDKARRHGMQPALDQLGVQHVSVPQVSAEALQQHVRVHTRGMKCAANTAEHFSVVVTHLRAIATAYAQGHAVALIIGEHVAVHRYPVLRDLGDAPSDWGILQLHMQDDDLAQLAYREPPARWLPHIWGYFGSVYAIRRSAMRAILQRYVPGYKVDGASSSASSTSSAAPLPTDVHLEDAPVPYNRYYYLRTCNTWSVLFNSVKTYASTDVWFAVANANAKQALALRDRPRWTRLPSTCDAPCLPLPRPVAPGTDCRVGRPTVAALPVYVMHLPKNTERRSFITGQLSGAGVDVGRVTFVDALAPTTADVEQLKADGMVHPYPTAGMRRPTFSLGEIGNYLTFGKVMGMAFEHGDEHFVIMEDDAVLPPDFQQRLQAHVDALPLDWDVFVTSWAKKGRNRGEPAPGGLLVPYAIGGYEQRGVFIGLECVVLTRCAISKLGRRMFPMALQFDKFLDMLKNTHFLRLYVPAVPITRQHTGFKSDLR